MRAARTLLFVPGDRPDRYEKAIASGADLVVVDLEDGVGPERKELARAAALEGLTRGLRYAVRLNAADSAWFTADLEAVATRADAIVIPKAEDPDALRGLVADVADTPIIAIVETARGVRDVSAVASTGIARLAFGNGDLAADIGIDHRDRRALLYSRSAVVVASAASGLPAPIDGVTTALDDVKVLEADALDSRRLGFGAKFCIHPSQLAVVAKALAPSDAQLTWAAEVLKAAPGASRVSGQMIDGPLIARARALLEEQ